MHRSAITQLHKMDQCNPRCEGKGQDMSKTFKIVNHMLIAKQRKPQQLYLLSTSKDRQGQSIWTD